MKAKIYMEEATLAQFQEQPESDNEVEEIPKILHSEPSISSSDYNSMENNRNMVIQPSLSTLISTVWLS